MALPKDPNMLVSFVNMKLRDTYESLAEFAAAEGTDEAELAEKLSEAGYRYDASGNRFIQREAE